MSIGVLSLKLSYLYQSTHLSLNDNL